MAYEIFKVDIYDAENDKQLESKNMKIRIIDRIGLEDWRNGQVELLAQTIDVKIELLLHYKELS